MELKKLDIVMVEGTEHMVLHVGTPTDKNKVMVYDLEGESEPYWVTKEQVTTKEDYYREDEAVKELVKVCTMLRSNVPTSMVANLVTKLGHIQDEMIYDLHLWQDTIGGMVDYALLGYGVFGESASRFPSADSDEEAYNMGVTMAKEAMEAEERSKAQKDAITDYIQVLLMLNVTTDTDIVPDLVNKVKSIQEVLLRDSTISDFTIEGVGDYVLHGRAVTNADSNRYRGDLFDEEEYFAGLELAKEIMDAEGWERIQVEK